MLQIAGSRPLRKGGARIKKERDGKHSILRGLFIPLEDDEEYNLEFAEQHMDWGSLAQ